jgi:hypothetical protein
MTSQTGISSRYDAIPGWATCCGLMSTKLSLALLLPYRNFALTVCYRGNILVSGYAFDPSTSTASSRAQLGIPGFTPWQHLSSSTANPDFNVRLKVRHKLRSVDTPDVTVGRKRMRTKWA